VLDFSIDPATAGAVHKLSYLLKNIAAERIREEFCKLICGRGAVRILREFSDVIAQFLPEMGQCVGFLQNSKYHCYDVYEHSIRALDFCESDDLMTRLAIFFHDVGKPASFTEDEKGGHFPGHAEKSVELTDVVLKRLRFDNATRELILKLVKYHDVPLIPEEKHIKRALLRFGEAGLRALLEIQRCDRLAHHPNYVDLPEYHSQIPKIVEKILAENACLSLKSLAVKGDDLIALGYKPGREIGEQLQTLLDAVIDGALPNDKDTLLSFVRLKTEAE
jgi:tRNA nucleotidyltransferase (CCA-adding enzyme)